MTTLRPDEVDAIVDYLRNSDDEYDRFEFAITPREIPLYESGSPDAGSVVRRVTTLTFERRSSGRWELISWPPDFDALTLAIAVATRM